jgi:hypothetical protein
MLARGRGTVKGRRESSRKTCFGIRPCPGDPEVGWTPWFNDSCKTEEGDHEPTWTRATKGPNEAFEYAELRYAACAAARGYGSTIVGVRLSSPQERTLETVITDWRGCRVDTLVPEVGFDKGRREQAIACLRGRGYLM